MTIIRVTKPADQLNPGDWLAPDQIPYDGGDPTEILGTFPTVDGAGPGVLLVFRTPTGLTDSIASSVYTEYELATDDEVRESQDAARRWQVAGQLRDLADLITSKSLPVPGEFDVSAVTFHFGGHVDQVTQVAELLGIEQSETYGTTAKLPSVGPLNVSWVAYKPATEA